MIPPAHEPISQRQAQARPELPGSLETELEQLLESETLEQAQIQAYETLQARALPEDVSSLLNKLVVVKLNGGLGTSMGVQGPKGLMEVRDDNTFLDLTIQQIAHLNKTHSCDVPLVLMNSSLTEEDTQRSLQRYSHCPVKIHTFLQSR
ncbi:UNVERIFIED_CONTAM: hypothetical protein FKN15_038877 [Acipenser sinensis]